jgi:hypothetical protein
LLQLVLEVGMGLGFIQTLTYQHVHEHALLILGHEVLLAAESGIAHGGLLVQLLGLILSLRCASQ